MYCIVSFPVRCQSGTFFGFFSVCYLLFFFGEFHQLKSMHIYIKEYKKHSGYRNFILFLGESKKKNETKIPTQVNNLTDPLAKLLSGSPRGKWVTNKMSTATTSNNQNDSSSLQTHLLSGSSTPG